MYSSIFVNIVAVKIFSSKTLRNAFTDNENCNGTDDKNMGEASPTPSATFSDDASTGNDSVCSSSQSDACNVDLEAKVEQEVRNHSWFYLIPSSC